MAGNRSTLCIGYSILFYVYIIIIYIYFFIYLFIYIQPQLGSLKLTFLMVKPPSWLLKSYIFHFFHHQKTASSSLAPFISEIARPPRWFSIGCLSESCELLELPQLDSRNGILPGKFEKKLINKYQVKYSEMVIQANVVGVSTTLGLNDQ